MLAIVVSGTDDLRCGQPTFAALTQAFGDHYIFLCRHLARDFRRRRCETTRRGADALWRRSRQLSQLAGREDPFRPAGSDAVNVRYWPIADIC